LAASETVSERKVSGTWFHTPVAAQVSKVGRRPSARAPRACCSMTSTASAPPLHSHSHTDTQTHRHTHVWKT